MANLTRCSICGAEYAYCPNCSGAHAWKFYTDTHEHYQIFVILKNYKTDFDKDKARNELENLGITSKADFSVFKPKIADQLKNIVTIEEKIELENEVVKPVTKKTKKSKLFDKD